MNATLCPSCGASTVFPGWIMSAGVIPPASDFAPGGVRSHHAVPIRQPFLSCLSCGHLWATIAPMAERHLIERFGRELAKQCLQSVTAGPHFDLPDVPEAHRAGECVAEIDFLILGGWAIEAIRRFRDLSGQNWDETHAVMRRWETLERAQKLAFFGWKSPDDSLAEKAVLQAQPMRDRDLDG